MYLQISGFISSVHQKTALFWPTYAVCGIWELYRLSKVFHEDTMPFLSTGIPYSRKWEEHFSKEATDEKY